MVTPARVNMGGRTWQRKQPQCPRVRPNPPTRRAVRFRAPLLCFCAKCVGDGGTSRASAHLGRRATPRKRPRGPAGRSHRWQGGSYKHGIAARTVRGNYHSEPSKGQLRCVQRIERISTEGVDPREGRTKGPKDGTPRGRSAVSSGGPRGRGQRNPHGPRPRRQREDPLSNMGVSHHRLAFNIDNKKLCAQKTTRWAPVLASSTHCEGVSTI